MINILKTITGLSGGKAALAFAGAAIVASFIAGIGVANTFWGAKQARAELKQSRIEVAQLKTAIATQKTLSEGYSDMILKMQQNDEANQSRMNSLAAAASRIPKDTVQYITTSKGVADAELKNNPSSEWILYPIPRSMLLDTQEALRATGKY